MNLQELKNILRAELPSQVIESTSVISEVDLLTGYLVGAVPKANLTVAAGQTKVLVQGSSGKDTIDLVAESVALGEAGDDLISTRDASGPNLVFGGAGGDHIIGGNTAALVFGGSRIAKDSENIYSLTDTSMDINIFDVDSGDVQARTAQFIGDFRVGVDKLRLGGKVLDLTAANYSQLVKNHGLSTDGIEVGLNAAPVLSQTLKNLTLELIPGTPFLASLQDLGVDDDGDDLELVVINGPDWISASGKKLVGGVPDSLKEQDLVGLNLHLGVTDGLAVVEFAPQLKLGQKPITAPGQAPVVITDRNGQTRTITVDFDGGRLPLQTTLMLQPILLKTRNSLQNQGIAANENVIDFQLHLDEGRESARAAFDFALVASSLDLTDGQGQRDPRRRLVYLAIDGQGNPKAFTYNPRNREGTRFFDLNGDGLPDFLTLSFQDGGVGDKDGLKNGVIVDPSTAGWVSVNPIFSQAGTSLRAVDPGNLNAPAALTLRAILRSRSATANQIGYVVLDNGESDTLTLEQLMQRQQTLFSNLEAADATLPEGLEFTRDFVLINGQRLRFFEVVDASLDELRSLNDPRFHYLDLGTVTDSSAAWISDSGLRFDLQLLPGDPGLSSLIAHDQSDAAVLDFSSFSGQAVRGQLVLSREASYDSLIGFYRTVDARGSVLNAAGKVLQPGQAGYADAALLTANRVTELDGLTQSNRRTTVRDIEVLESTHIAPFALVNGQRYFAFGAANSDGISHFRVLGDNIFGLEDLYGGGDRDFDDMVMSFNFREVIV